jgi:putative addiction module CopG family antidote
MSLTLPPDLQRFVEGQLLSGGYSNEGELLTAAVLALRQQKLAELKARIQPGIDQADRGEGTLLENDEALDRFIDTLGGFSVEEDGNS